MARLVVTLSVGVVLVLMSRATTSAQYPSPANVAVVSVSNPTPGMNATVTITWRTQGPQGALRGGEAQEQRRFAISLQTAPSGALACVPGIASQPGSDARVTVRSGLTDPSIGIADLFTGSTPGPIVVRITCPDGPSADITVMVQSTATPTATSASTPANDRAGTPRPPSTGFGGVPAAGAGSSSAAIASLFAVVALVGVAAALLLLRRRARRGDEVAGTR